MAKCLVSRPGDAKILISMPDYGKVNIWASRPNKSVNHISLMFVIHRKLAFYRVKVDLG